VWTEVFNEMRANQLAPNRYVYTTLLTLLIREKRPFEAIKLFEDVTEQGLRPDIPLYNSLMAAYNAVGMYAKAAELFKEIQQFPRFRYNPATYGTALATTSKSGNSTAALEVMAALKSQRRVQMNTIHYTQIITAW
jgi:pentatricopeptide repeat protein